MRTMMLGVLVVLGSTAMASAQPGQQQPAPPQQQPYYPPPAYAYQPPPQPRMVQLTPDEQDLLEIGEISDVQWAGGGAAAMFIGFGVGQAVQGRWSDTGWMYALGESASFVALIVGAVESVGNDCGMCDSNHGQALLVGGAIAFAGLRVGEVVDALVVPPRHNVRLYELRARLGLPAQPGYVLAPYIAPSASGVGGGGVAGLSIRF
jgi:hypothetical protein